MNKAMSDKRRFQQRNKRVIRIPHRGDEGNFCHCAPLETRIEDFTLKRWGQEITRKLELQVCLDCKEQYLPGRPVIEMEKEIEAKVLALANERFEVPADYMYLKYYDDVDILYIKCSNNKCVISDDDVDKGLVFDLDKDENLVGIEILDFYGKFTESESE